MSKYLKTICTGLLLLLCYKASSGNYWLGSTINPTDLKAGDYVYISTDADAIRTWYLNARKAKQTENEETPPIGLDRRSSGASVFELITAPQQQGGTPSFYLRNIARNKYIACKEDQTPQTYYVNTTAEATSFELSETGKTQASQSADAVVLVHYEGNTKYYLLPDVKTGRIIYSAEQNKAQWTVKEALTKGQQIGANDIKDGICVLFNNATNYQNAGPAQFLSPEPCTEKNPNYNSGFPLAITNDYDEMKVWAIVRSDDKYIVQNISTKEYLCYTASDGIRISANIANALTMEFESVVGNYTVQNWWVTNEKSLVMYHTNGSTKMKIGPYRSYGYTYYGTGSVNIPWNVFLVNNHPTEHDVLGYDESIDPDAIEGTEQKRYRTVVMDFGKPHVISHIKFRPIGTQRTQLGIFEGANTPEFTDAVPFHMIKEVYTMGQDVEVDINCSRGFRYVRYVGPNGTTNTSIRISYYGEPGVGNDSHLYQVTNLPTVVINTEGERAVTSKQTYLPGIATIISKDGASVLTDSMDVRGRGNGTWTLDKKPYKLKWRHKHRVLDFPANAKKWTLLANHQDKSLMRNLVGFEMSRQVGMIYTPKGTSVDVIVNGEYMGNFNLCDQMEVKKHRIEVEEMTPEDNTEPNISGGYLLELDGYASSEPVHFFSSVYNAPITVHYPKDDAITAKQLAYIKNHYEEMERRLFNTVPLNPRLGIPSYMDVTSFLKRFIVEEATANADAYWSVYIMKKRNDNRLYFDPVWDLDHIYDIFSPSSPSSSFDDYLSLVKGSNQGNIRGIIKRVITLYEDSLINMWSNLRIHQDLTYAHYEHFIDSIANAIDESQRLNFIRWPVLSVELPYGTGIRYTYKAEVDFLKETLKTRLSWMDNHVGLICDPGDVNRDDHINLGDLVGIAYILINNKNAANFLTPAADIDGNKTVNRTDLLKFIDQLLHEEQPDIDEEDKAPALSISGEAIHAGEEGILNVAYDNSKSTVTALQFDVQLPEGLTVEKTSLPTSVSVQFRSNLLNIGNNTWRFVYYNYYGTDIASNTPILQIHVKASDTFTTGEYDIHTSLAIGSTSETEVVQFADGTNQISIIQSLGLEQAKQERKDGISYDLQGRRVQPDHKGIIINNRKKYRVK